MIKRPKISEFTRQTVGQQYCLGDVDCFALILDYMERAGVKIPDEFDGVTQESYVTLYQNDPDHAKQVMVDFMDHMLPTIGSNFAKSGDITLFRLKDSDTAPFLAIETANANIVAVSKELGVSPTPRNRYDSIRSWQLWPKQ